MDEAQERKALKEWIEEMAGGELVEGVVIGQMGWGDYKSNSVPGYADRKRGSDVGLYTGTVRGNMTPYAKPMENGNHEDVRWAAVTGTGC